MEEEIEKQPIPWAVRKEIGVLKALWQTARQILLKPLEFFANLEVKDSYVDPLSFYIIVVTVVTAVHLILSLMFYVMLNKNFSPLLILASLFLVPIVATIGIFAGSALSHLFILLFKGQGGFKGTFNVLAYNAATSAFVILPFIGQFIAVVANIAIGVIGFKQIHRLNTAKAILAYAIPIIVIFLLSSTSMKTNLLKARLSANESLAKATIRTISTAVELYAADNRRYPADEYELRYSSPSYLPDTYHDKIISGYKYSLNLNPARYEVAAVPVQCRVTGNKIFKINKSGNISEEACK